MGNGFSALFEKYTSIVAFDVETSGLDPYFDQIVELGAQRLFQKNGELLAEPLHYFIKLYDGHRMDEDAASVNHITESMLEKNGVSIEKAMSDFKRLIEGKTLLVAHNANFDMLFITVAALKINEKKFFQHLDVVDTLTVFKDRAPYPHKLSDAIAHYVLIQSQRHSEVSCLFRFLFYDGQTIPVTVLYNVCKPQMDNVRDTQA